jgi:hypothetical protein
MNTEEELNLIDKYVQGNLTPEERAAFELRLNSDQEFENAYMFVLSVQQVTQNLEAERIKNMLKRLSEEEDRDNGSVATVINFVPEHIETINNQSEGKSFTLWPYIKFASVAAVLLIAFFIWQPNKSSNEELFQAYTSGSIELPAISMNEAEFDNLDNNVRGGDEYLFKGYTYEESVSLQEAIALVNKREFASAKNIFTKYLKHKEKNPGLLLHLAISQLNTKEISLGVSNLEYLKSLHQTAYQQDINFHLAMGYIKSGKKKEAKQILQSIKKGNGKYSNHASWALQKMRWF